MASNFLTYQWLGVAGLAFHLDGYTLLVDPFFTRPSWTMLVTGARVAINENLVARYAPQADAVLVTHPHYDHIMDVPEVLRRTGALAYGSKNACTLLSLHGIPDKNLRCLSTGDHFQAGPFSIEVFPAVHTRVPFRRFLDGPFPDQAVLRPPLRLWQYRMDLCFTFLIKAGGKTILVGNHPVPADLAFIAPYIRGKSLECFLTTAKPQTVVPIHWDDFFRPLSKPQRPMLVTSAQGLQRFFPPAGRVDLNTFSESIRGALPAAQVCIPELFKTENLLSA